MDHLTLVPWSVDLERFYCIHFTGCIHCIHREPSINRLTVGPTLSGPNIEEVELGGIILMIISARSICGGDRLEKLSSIYIIYK